MTLQKAVGTKTSKQTETNVPGNATASLEKIYEL